MWVKIIFIFICTKLILSLPLSENVYKKTVTFSTKLITDKDAINKELNKFQYQDFTNVSPKYNNQKGHDLPGAVNDDKNLNVSLDNIDNERIQSSASDNIKKLINEEQGKNEKNGSVHEKPNNYTVNYDPDDIPDDVTWRIVTKEVETFEYDYDSFKSEYEKYVFELNRKENLTYNELKLVPTSICRANSWYNKGVFTIICLFKEKNSGPTRNVRNSASTSFWNLIKLWILIITVIFIIAWCQYGFCSGCFAMTCPFDVCNREDFYEKLKQELCVNRPGRNILKLMSKKKFSNDKIDKLVHKQSILNGLKETYVPSETEIFLYMKMWKSIYHT